MSKLGFIFDMYVNDDAFPNSGKKQKIQQSSKVQPLNTNYRVLKAFFHGQERKRKDGWVPVGAKTGTSVVSSYNQANKYCSIPEKPHFKVVDCHAAIQIFNDALVQHNQEEVKLMPKIFPTDLEI